MVPPVLDGFVIYPRAFSSPQLDFIPIYLFTITETQPKFPGFYRRSQLR